MQQATLANGERILWADPRDAPFFPPPQLALEDPPGLVLIGGTLDPDWLSLAYRSGIFPWFTTGDPILWWSPDPRTLLYPAHFKLQRSLAKVIRNGDFQVTLNQSFAQVIRQCAAQRETAEGTWITANMESAYTRLHRLGMAHSVEVWQQGQLVGGLYGVAQGNAFFGESMFSCVSNASKVALAALCIHLVERQTAFIDCQFATDHLRSLGAVSLSRQTFLAQLQHAMASEPQPLPWQLADDWRSRLHLLNQPPAEHT